jgi:hypothetical protein
MSNTVPIITTTPGTTSADTSKLTPEAVIEQLRSIQSQIDEVAPLSKQQRALLKTRLRTQPTPIVNASINVMDVSGNVSQAIGHALGDVRQIQDEALRWDAVIEQASAFLKGLEGANLVRRQRLAIIGRQAYAIGTQLAIDPANAVLVPHVEEVKRLKVASRRKKTAGASQTPEAPTTPAPTTPAPSTTTPKTVE